MERVFVIGATGFIGKKLIPELMNAGYEVTALVREKSNFSFLQHAGVKIVIGDILEPSSYSRELADSKYGIYLAGVVTDWAPILKYTDVHVIGLKYFLNQCQSLRVKRMIHFSTVDVLQKSGNGDIVLSERSPITKSQIPYDKTKAEGEQIALWYASNSKTEVVVLRPVWVYGVGDTTLFPEIAFQTKRGQMVLVGSKNTLIPLVHVKNLVKATILALKKEGINGETFLISDGEKTWKYISDLIAETVGGKKPQIIIPYRLAYALGAAMEFIGRLIHMKRRPLLTRTAVEMLGKSLKIDTSKARNILGYQPAIKLDEGISEVIDWIKKSKIDDLRVK